MCIGRFWTKVCHYSIYPLQRLPIALKEEESVSFPDAQGRIAEEASDSFANTHPN